MNHRSVDAFIFAIDLKKLTAPMATAPFLPLGFGLDPTMMAGGSPDRASHGLDDTADGGREAEGGPLRHAAPGGSPNPSAVLSATDIVERRLLPRADGAAMDPTDEQGAAKFQPPGFLVVSTLLGIVLAAAGFLFEMR